VTSEPRVTAPVDLCGPDGNLNPAAIGWSPQPLHDCDLSGSKTARKLWDHWWVIGDKGAFAMTYANLGCCGFVNVMFVDFEAKKQKVFSKCALTSAASVTHGRQVRGGRTSFDKKGVTLVIDDDPAAAVTRLKAGYRKSSGEQLSATFLVQRPPAHQSLNVALPFVAGRGDRFQFTSKENTLPASGQVRLNDEVHDFDGSWAVLDFGRGVWPFTAAWNWAAGSGRQDGRLLGLQWGGKWTDLSGLTENGVCLDGVLHKIGERVTFRNDLSRAMEPWHIASSDGGVGLKFTPFMHHSQRLAGFGIDICFGHFDGVVPTHEGSLPVKGLLGFAEDFKIVW
jgi:hypothetical protein